MAEGLQKKNLDTSPDETRTFDHGVMKTATVGDFEVAREVLEPGWEWSEDIKPIVGTDSCQFQHYGMLLSAQNLPSRYWCRNSLGGSSFT
jgi:hypothetical protein